MAREAAEFDWKSFPNDLKRQFSKISDIGTSALPDKSKLREVSLLLKFTVQIIFFVTLDWSI